MTEIWRWSAQETAKAIAAKAVSAREVTESVLARIDATNPTINALPYVLHDEALAAASAADAWQAAGKPLGVLHGVPVTTKVNVDQKGCATTGGLTALKDLVATEDSPLVVWSKFRLGAV